MRIPLIAGNWKMFKTVAETVAFVTDLLPFQPILPILPTGSL